MEKGDKRGRVEKNGGERGKGALWLYVMDAPGIRISNKKPQKILAASQPTGDGYAVERDRREGNEG